MIAPVNPSLFTFNVDLGQVLIGSIIAIIGWFFKRTIDSFATRLDAHDKMLFDLSSSLQNLMGAVGQSIVSNIHHQNKNIR